jgi:hypothetical protein
MIDWKCCNDTGEVDGDNKRANASELLRSVGTSVLFKITLSTRTPTMYTDINIPNGYRWVAAHVLGD